MIVKDIHDSHDTVSNIFGPYLRDLLFEIWEIYEKCSNSVNFWPRKIGQNYARNSDVSKLMCQNEIIKRISQESYIKRDISGVMCQQWHVKSDMLRVMCLDCLSRGTFCQGHNKIYASRVMCQNFFDCILGLLKIITVCSVQAQ